MPRIDEQGVRHVVLTDEYDEADFPHIAQCPECQGLFDPDSTLLTYIKNRARRIT